MGKAILVDYDGTLRGFEAIPSAAVPTEELLYLLSELDRRDDVDVSIVSGRDSAFLDTHFSRFNFSVVAEHGYMIREGKKDWEVCNPHTVMAWKDLIRPIMRMSEQSTPGAFLEEKRSALVWHYRNCTSQYGRAKARDMLFNLEASCVNLPVEVQHGKMIVEVSSLQVQKGISLARLLRGKKYEA